jgi:GR25 family glycosyltransferase involved in LPS biosynthesis
MECLYINVDGEIARQRSIEANFRQVDHGEWNLTRISAVDTKQVVAACVKGRLRPAEKGCFLSHIKAIELCRTHTSHTLLVEDDVLFGRKTFSSIEAALDSIAETDWDIMFTDVCVPTLETMLQMYFLRRQLPPGQNSVLKLDSTLPFGGSTAYLVNKHSVDKILSVLKEAPLLDIPYDLTLRKLFNESRLKGVVVFPFLTSLTESADVSQIQSISSAQVTDIIWNSFRRFIWAERSLDTATATLDPIAPDFLDDECKAFSKILSCMLSSRYRPK